MHLRDIKLSFSQLIMLFLVQVLTCVSLTSRSACLLCLITLAAAQYSGRGLTSSSVTSVTLGPRVTPTSHTGEISQSEPSLGLTLTNHSYGSHNATPASLMGDYNFVVDEYEVLVPVLP